MDDATAFFARRAATRVVPNPSRRTPHKSTEYNNADVLERDMQKYGYTNWGFVIYRCTYRDDEQWKQFLALLTQTIDQGLEVENAMDMKASLDYPIIEDASTLEGADAATVHRQFQEWSRTAPEDGRHGKIFSPRYQYCLFVDQAALDSITKSGEDESGYINLLYLRGHGSTTASGDEALHSYHMRVNFGRLMLGWWAVFKDQGIWDSQYREPPAVLQY